MAIAAGHSKTVTDGLIFGYDTGDRRNSFKGKDTSNLLNAVSYVYGTQDGALFKSNYGTETVNIPAIGQVSSHYVNIYNDYGGGSGACCLSLFAFGSFAVSPSTAYTYQIIYKTTNGYSHPNYMYHYEYGPGGYVTEYGLHSTSREVDLGDGWKMGWGTFTSNANTNSFTTYLFHYEYGNYNKVQLAGIMLTQGNIVYHPQHFLNISTSRSAASTLNNLSPNNYTINPSSISYTTEPTVGGDMVFDGTDDFIDTNFGVNDSLTQVTYEAVIFDTKNNAGYRAIIQNNVASDDALYIQPGNNLGFWPCTTTYLTVPANRFVHVVFSYDGTTMRYSVNGAQHAFAGTCADCLDFDFLRIGAHSAGDGERFAGRIPVAKIYNRALSEKEIEQNFNLYASRFGINPVVKYSEGANAANFVNNWNDATTFTMAQFGGLGPATAHGFTSGPVNFTLTLPGLATHSRIRYRVKWHLVDSLDNETSRMYIGNGSTETEVLTFTKVYNAAPSVSLAGGQLTTSWSGHQTYSHRPWGNGVYGADGYLDIDSGWIDHTSSTLTVRHFMGADQAQADEAMYLTHVEVLTAH